MDCKNINFGEL